MDKNKEEFKRNFLQKEKEYQPLVGQILALAKDKGATQAEVALSYDKGLSVTTRLREVETVEFNQDKGVGVTVYVGQRRASVSSSDTSKAAIEKVVERALEIAKVSDEDKCYGLADKELLSDTYPSLDLYHPWDMDALKAIELAKECEDIALTQDKRIVNSEGSSVGSYQFLRFYANTNGFHGCYTTTRHTRSCVLLGEDAKGLQRDYDYTTARNSDDLCNSQTLAQNAVDKTLKRLNAQKITTRKAPVIFKNDVSSTILSALISAISGGNIYRRSSFLLDHIDKTIFPSRYDVYEEPHLPGALGSAPYDGEGVLTRNNRFVEAGVLKSYCLGSYSARRLGLQTTANAGGVHNLAIKHDDLSFDEMLKKMDTGLVVTELMGQGTNIVTGDYSRGAQGFWVENGEIQFPVEEITIASNLKDMFSHIVAIGNDIDRRKATRCGSILLEEMTIAGQ